MAPFRIGEIYAWLGVDENDEEGVAAFRDGAVWTPLVMADRARMDSVRPLVEGMAASTGRRLRLVRFTQREDVEEVGG